MDIAKHFQDLLDEERKGRNLSPREVGKVIRKGYETLRVREVEGLERWVRWREGEERGLLKRVARCVVDDAKKMVGGG